MGRLRRGPTSLSAREVLHMATVGSAACLGRAGERGIVAPGAPADLVAWPLEGVQFAGAHSDLVEAWLRCGPVSARHTMVNGEFVVRDSRIVRSGLEDMLNPHRAISRAWLAAASDLVSW